MPTYGTKPLGCSRAGRRYRLLIAASFVIVLAAASLTAMMVVGGLEGRPYRRMAPKTARPSTGITVMKPDKAAALISDRDHQMYRSVFHWLQTPTSSCSDLRAVGSESVCFDAPLAPVAAGCLVYSVGVGADWSFERQMAERGCEVHMFDPVAKTPEGAAAAGVHFHPWGVAMNMGQRGNRIWVTLADIIADLGHEGRRVQFLKVDGENAGTDVLYQQLAVSQTAFVLDQVDQIAVALQLPTTQLQSDPKMNMMYDMLEMTLVRAGEVGFRLVRSTPLGQPQYWFPGVDGAVCSSYYLLMVRTGRDTFDRIDRNKEPRLKDRLWF